MKLAVITEIPDPLTSAGRGNLASALGSIFVDTGTDNPIVRFEELPGLPGFGVQLALALRLEVFNRGEILVLDNDGREVSGRGRKPSKWGVRYESFGLEEIELALKVAESIPV